MANLIRKIREEVLGLDQGELAKELDWKQSKLSRIENSIEPKTGELKEIAKVFTKIGSVRYSWKDLISDDDIDISDLKTRTVCFVAEKGGSGKTTTSYNIASYAAKIGKKTLLIDLDPQQNATISTLDFSDIDKHMKSIYHVFTDYVEGGNNINLNDICIQSKNPDLQKLFVVPADRRLNQIDVMFKDETTFKHFPYILRNTIAQTEGFDLIVVDTPPGNSGKLTTAALIACNEVIMCAQALGSYQTKNIKDLQSTLNDAQKNNPDFRINGCIINMYQKRTNIAKETLKAIENMGVKVFSSRIPFAVSYPEAAMNKLPVFFYSEATKEAVEPMESLAKEVLNG